MHAADRAQLGIPSIELIRMAAWRGGTPAHTDISLVCAPTGAEALRQMRLVRSQVERHGFDYAGGLTLNARHAVTLALVSFDKGDPDERRQVVDLFAELIPAASADGYAPYRSHVEFMDLIADQYDAGNSALRRFVERLKVAADPLNILAPGKQGIWGSPGSRAGVDQRGD